ncbi:MAG: hypothetical protein M3O34_04925, partial [Chloroflexota bacterium]|nr:hypothetical protein [Chloroflexota bacterium]
AGPGDRGPRARPDDQDVDDEVSTMLNVSAHRPAERGSARRSSRAFPRGARRWLAAAAALALVLPLPARPASAQLASATAAEIVANAGAYDGQAVTVVGDVDDVLGPRSFVIEDDDVLSFARLPVVTARPILDRAGRPLDRALDPLSTTNVMVTGTVHQFNLAAFEDRLGLDLDDQQWAAWAGKPAIIATSVIPRPRYLSWQAATVDDIADHPEVYAGKAVTVRGEVGEALGSRSFALEEDDLLFEDAVLVLTTGQMTGRDGRPLAPDALVDRPVWVTGTVRLFNRVEVERDLGIDLDDELFAEWEGRPAIVARSIRPGSDD